MVEYIEREALLQDIEGSVCFTAKTGTISPEMRGANKVIDRIKCAPVANVAPVVRCKDCKWLYDEMDDYCCRSHRGLVRICENSFCSYGERKDGYGNG